MPHCLHCQKQILNPKFCNRSCAASFNNSKAPKRTKGTYFCKECKTFEVNRKNALCVDCRDRPNLTLAQAIYSAHHKSSAFALVRSRARSTWSKTGITSCQICGYSRHIEIAHKRPISSFSDDALVSEINDISNLLALCPNCHWEYDHGLIDHAAI